MEQIKSAYEELCEKNVIEYEKNIMKATEDLLYMQYVEEHIWYAFEGIFDSLPYEKLYENSELLQEEIIDTDYANKIFESHINPVELKWIFDVFKRTIKPKEFPENLFVAWSNNDLEESISKLKNYIDYNIGELKAYTKCLKEEQEAREYYYLEMEFEEKFLKS